MNMMGNPMMGGAKDYTRILQPEKESVNIISNFSVIEDAVDDVIKKYGSK